MFSVLLTVYLVLGGLAVLQAVLVNIQTWEHRRFAPPGLGSFIAMAVSDG